MTLTEQQTVADSAPKSYRSSAVFDERTLPAALRSEHRTKPGVWGVVFLLAGQLKLNFIDPPETKILSPGVHGLLLPDQPHFVELIGSVRVRIDFYDQLPKL